MGLICVVNRSFPKRWAHFTVSDIMCIGIVRHFLHGKGYQLTTLCICHGIVLVTMTVGSAQLWTCVFLEKLFRVFPSSLIPDHVWNFERVSSLKSYFRVFPPFLILDHLWSWVFAARFLILSESLVSSLRNGLSSRRILKMLYRSVSFTRKPAISNAWRIPAAK